MLENKIRQIEGELRKIDDFLYTCRDRRDAILAEDRKDYLLEELRVIERQIELRRSEGQQFRQDPIGYGYEKYNNNQNINYGNNNTNNNGNYGYDNYRRPVVDNSGAMRIKNERVVDKINHNNHMQPVNSISVGLSNFKPTNDVKSMDVKSMDVNSRYDYICSDNIKVTLELGNNNKMVRVLCGYEPGGNNVAKYEVEVYEPLKIDMNLANDDSVSFKTPTHLFNNNFKYGIQSALIMDKMLNNQQVKLPIDENKINLSTISLQGKNILDYFATTDEVQTMLNTRYVEAINFMCNLHGKLVSIGNLNDIKEIVEKDYITSPVALNKELLNMLEGVVFSIDVEDGKSDLKVTVKNVVMINVPILSTQIIDKIMYLSQDSHKVLYDMFVKISNDTDSNIINFITSDFKRYTIVISKTMNKAIVYENNGML